MWTWLVPCCKRGINALDFAFSFWWVEGVARWYLLLSEQNLLLSQQRAHLFLLRSTP
jgi:hypothetical protein